VKKGRANERGRSIMVNGASGQLGRCSVHLALAYGAKKIYCMGRSLERLKKAFSGIDNARLHMLTFDDVLPQHSVDTVIDFLGMVGGSMTEKSVMALRPKGILVCAGGVHGNITVNYNYMLTNSLTICGSLMFDEDCPREVIKMLSEGTLILPKREYHIYPMKRANDAVADAFKDRKRLCILQMNSLDVLS